MAGYAVDPVLLQEAKAAVDQGVRHYRTLANDLSHQISALRGSAGGRPGLEAFEGGYGLHGHYQQLLSAFGSAWLTKFAEFIADEHAFVTFLEGFSTRLQDTHQLYQELELRAEKAFTDIGDKLIGGR